MNPNRTIGIIGGGQLARMLATAAAELGFEINIYCPDRDCPAAQVANKTVLGNYDDKEKLVAFAKNIDVLTYEFENIDTKALEELEKVVDIRPSVKALKISQDRYTEKTYLNSLGIKTTQFYKIDEVSDIEKHFIKIKKPILIKTRRLGYDGKGQVLIKTQDDINEHFLRNEFSPSIAEEVLRFDKELSVIIVRDKEGNTKAFEPGENVHERGILVTTTLPSSISEALRNDATEIAKKIVGDLDYIGVMGVEFFLKGKELLVNEIAPRVHNSGHWTMDGSYSSQFQQHIRAIMDLPLLSTERHSDIVMYNLIGKVSSDFSKNELAKVYIYGKKDPRPGRKMGHVNLIKKKGS
ncbi:MAG: N5-carboxyaminoimidazole ribonucleotide synthase [Paracoccaceae bacterium]|nr:MAG: N5-carboxyaminoimidazole ribonucleotide synthase [Paracoccaceae bacterium]